VSFEISFRLFRYFGHISTMLDVCAHGLTFGLPSRGLKIKLSINI